jgi:hypothetical protein
MLDQKEKSLIFNAKIVQYLAVNRNVISIERGNLNDSFPESNSGVFFVREHHDLFTKAIKLYQKRVHINNKNPYSFYLKNYSPAIVEKLIHNSF